MNPRLERILELAELTGRINDPKFRRLMLRLSRVPDPSFEEMLLRKLTVEAGDEAFDPRPFRVPSQEQLVVPGCEGLPYISFGDLARLEPHGIRTFSGFSCPLSTFHWAWLGQTRMGKSTGVRQMLAALPKHIRCLIVDSENDPAYADLALSFPPEEFQVIDWRELKVGLFAEPPNTARQIWLAQVKRNLREGLFLRDGSMSMLSVLFEHCQRERPGLPIALGHLYQKLSEHRYELLKAGREYQFYESLKNRLEGLLANPIYDCAVGFDIRKLVSTNTLLRCRGMGDDDFALMVNDLLLRLACHFEPELEAVPQLVVVLEEVHRLAHRERLKRADISELIILTAVRALAKCRVSLVFVDQVPSELPVQLLANTSFRLIFNTIEGRDLDAIQRSLGLDWRQRVSLSHLPTRLCLVQYGNPSFPEPFLVRIRDCELQLPLPEAIDERVKATLSNLDYVPSEKPKSSGSPSPKAQESLPLISLHAQQYLTEISKDQFLPASRRDQDQPVPIPLSQGNALRKELLKSGLIVLERVNTYSKARTITNTLITEKGYAYLKSLGIAFELPRGKGGPEHRYFQYWIAHWGKQNGYEAIIEHFHGGKSVDVGLEKDGRRIAVEILCQGVEKELNNLRDLHTGYSEIWFCVKDMTEARRLRELIALKFVEEAPAILELVSFKLLGQFQEVLGTEQPSSGQDG